MISRLAIGCVAAAALVGCLPPNATTTTSRPLKPTDGPRASIHVDYFGGVYTRQIQTRFHVDRASYVVVGHLGGDGEIRILYPETPRASGWVAAGKTVTLKPRSAMYDMSPHLFSFASAPYRNRSSAYESYDGLGHGYVFIIASRSPIDHQALAAGKEYESVTVNDYDSSTDLRYAVRQFADEIVTGPYTLQYARNPNTSLFAQLSGCPSRWGLSAYGASPFDFGAFGFPFFYYPGSSLFTGFAFAQQYVPGYGYGAGYGRSCRGMSYASAERLYYRSNTYVPVVPAAPGPVTPELQRPTRRTFQDHQRKPLLSGHSAIDRRPTRTNPREGAEWRPSARRPNSGSSGPDFPGRSSSGSSSSGSTEIHRAARPADTPRLHTPAPPPPPPPTTIPTTTSTTSTGNGTRAERPNPRP